MQHFLTNSYDPFVGKPFAIFLPSFASAKRGISSKFIPTRSNHPAKPVRYVIEPQDNCANFANICYIREIYRSLDTSIEAVAESVRAMKNITTLIMMSEEDAGEVGAYFALPNRYAAVGQ